MRVTKIELSGFRGFSHAQTFELDADAIIVVGANGRGKTSLFDGILWALTGTIPRLGEQGGVVSKYSESGEAYVSLTLRAPNGELCRISRSTDEKAQRLRLEINGDPVGDSLAATKLFEKVWPEALLTASGVDALTTALTRSVYLQQDLVRQFIESDKDQERFKSVSELVGVGRVTELQSAIERAKNAWTRATTAVEKDLEGIRSRRSGLRNQLEALAGAKSQDTTGIDAIWENWWRQVQGFGVNVPKIPSAMSAEAPSKVDEVMKHLAVIRRSVERRIFSVDELLSDIKAKQSVTVPNLLDLRSSLDEAERNLKFARESLAKAELLAAEERRRQIELRETHEELKTIAQLALRHLGSECPVCGQEYDKTRTRKRLEKLIGLEIDQTKIDTDNIQVKELATTVKELEQARMVAETALREAEDSLRNHQLWIQERDSRLSELDIKVDSGEDMDLSLSKLKTSLEQSMNALTKAQGDSENIALMLASASELARKTEISNEFQKVELEVGNLEKALRERQSTADLTSQILNGLRDAAYFVVESRLKDVETLLQNIYSTIDPHPAFRTVRFLTSLYRGHGLLDTQIDDSARQVSSDSPQTILSSSQMNALAVAVFLSFNLAVRSLPLHAAILDDPLQSLDDVNLLGVIDLLRRVRDKRQLFISTHDVRFGQLLELKLRPIRNQQTLVIELTGWDRQGPKVVTRELAADCTPLRILV